jgi:hypothetical protein
MLKLNVNEEKQLTFEVQIGGVGNESITVDLPPLNKVIGSKLKEGEEVAIKLEMIADGYYLTPWQDTVKISNPLVVEAKIKDVDFIPKPAIKTNLVVAEDGAKQTTTLSKKEKEDEKLSKDEKKVDEPSDEMVGKLAEKLITLLGKQEGKIVEQDEDKEEDIEDEKVSKVVEPKKAVESKMGAIEKLLTDTVNKIQTEGRTSKRKINLQELKKNVTEEDIMKYIENAGTKNPKIKEIIYEQASAASSKHTPFEILRQVVKIMKK